MQRVLTALLQIAEAESGTVGARPEPVALDLMLDELGELYQPQAEQQGVALSVSCEPGSRVLGHRQLLAQAVANLIDNALKFTPAGGRVDLRTQVGGRPADHLRGRLGAGDPVRGPRPGRGALRAPEQRAAPGRLRPRA